MKLAEIVVNNVIKNVHPELCLKIVHNNDLVKYQGRRHLLTGRIKICKRIYK